MSSAKSFRAGSQDLLAALRMLPRSAFCRLWILRGQEKHGGGYFELAFAGSAALKEYFSRLVFAGTPKEISLGATPCWSVDGKAQRNAPSCAMLVAEIPPQKKAFFRIQPSFLTPVWIKMRLLPEEAFVSKRKRYAQIERRIEKASLASEIRTDEASFDRFYFDMYLPYVKKRHQGMAVVEEHVKMKERFFKNRCELHLVKSGDVSVTGNVIDYSEGDAHLVFMGIASDANEKITGLVDALYYLSLKRAAEKGMKSVDLGHCRPFPGDSVAQAKKELGGKFVNEKLERAGVLALRFLQLSEALKSFLVHNPFISLKENNYQLRVFSDSPENGEENSRWESFIDPAKIGMEKFYFNAAPAPSPVRNIPADPLPAAI